MSQEATKFTFQLNSDAVSVEVPENSTSKEELLSFPAFKTWTSTLAYSLSLQSKPSHVFHTDPYRVSSIAVQSIDRFGGKRLGFVKLRAEVTNNAGEHLPGSVFLRGGSVGMLVVLHAKSSKGDSSSESYVVLTVQPRIPAGSLSLAELPAGMLDDSGTFAGAAAKEIKEELDMYIAADELLDMTQLALPEVDEVSGEKLQRGVYMSPGGCDEFVPLFLCQKEVDADTLKDWEGKFTGLRDHGEKITLKVVKLDDLWKEGSRDGKALAAWALYNGLKKEGKL